jgi:dihydroneopterin aldolase
MSDRIELRGLRIVATHGVLPFEKERAQPFEIDADVYLDLRQAGETDDLRESVSYSVLVKLIDETVRSEQNELLERIAGRVAEQLLRQDRVEKVDLTVRKLRPPVPFDLETAAVRIVRP